MSPTPKVLDSGVETDDPLIGVELGGFRVRRLLAQGGMGLVYEAVHEAIGRRAAVKVLKPEIARDRDWTRRFLSEARVLGALKHRNLIEILNFGKTPDGREFLMMEFLDGRPLDHVMSQGEPMAPSVALGLVDQILNGLSEAHKKGVVHRDLKPSNIHLLREHNGETLVKVLDFGLARHDPVSLLDNQLDQQQSKGASIVAGTPEYIAPEQAQGHAVSAAADLYSLGVIMFELLSGRLPFDDTGINRLLRQHIEQPPPRLGTLVEDLPDGVEDLVDSLLRKRPSERPGSADEVRISVQRILKRIARETTAIRPRPNPVPDPTTITLEVATSRDLEPARSRRVPAIAMLAVGAVFVVIVSSFWAGRALTEPNDGVRATSTEPGPASPPLGQVIPPAPPPPSAEVAEPAPEQAEVPARAVPGSKKAPAVAKKASRPVQEGEPCEEGLKQHLHDQLDLGEDLKDRPRAYAYFTSREAPLHAAIAAAKTAADCEAAAAAVRRLKDELRALGEQ
ncbi:MAG: serine/threonine protein kinase [Myxococcaceae bacterium]|jgi:serine/threonine-protein kinase|nr:serine/threonine protein kinase [Myxococcaceae bacterium]